MKRAFVIVSAVVAAIVSLGCCSKSCKSNGEDGAYTAILMSDTHYDKRKYDVNTNLPRYWVGEAGRNYGMWDNGDDSISYKMLDQVAAVKDDSTAFIIHCGDLIQGDCDSYESTAMCVRDAIADITGRTGLPLYMAADNHDSSRYMGTADEGRYPTYGAPQDRDKRDGKPVRPTTAERGEYEKAYLTEFRLYHDASLETARFQEPSFMTKVYNKDVYIFTRATQDGIEYLDEELAKYPKDSVRYTFVVIHLAPMVGKSYGTDKPWQVDSFSYYTEATPHKLIVRDQDLKDKVMAELAAREAIVFAGHKHFWEKIDAQFPTGVIHQLMVNTNDVDYSKKWDECHSYEDFAAHAEKEGKGSTLDVGGAEKVLDYRLFSDRGFAKLRISDEGVYADVYSCKQDGKMIETLKLR